MHLHPLVVALAALLAATPALSAPRVVTDFLPTQSLVARVMEGVGAPVSIVPPGASPHTYSMRPSQARTLAEAEVVIRVGEALAPWFEKAIEGLAEDAVKIELMTAPGVAVLGFPERGHADEHHGEGEDEHADEHEDEHGEGHAGAHEDEHEEGHGGEHEDEHGEGHADEHEGEHGEGHAGAHEDEHGRMRTSTGRGTPVRMRTSTGRGMATDMGMHMPTKARIRISGSTPGTLRPFWPRSRLGLGRSIRRMPPSTWPTRQPVRPSSTS